MTNTADRNPTVNALLGVLLVLLALLSWQLIGHMKTQQSLSQDLAELRHVRYGMLNADIWVNQVSEIVENQVRDLEIQGAKRESVRHALENILDTLLTAADEYVRLQNTTGDWWDRTTGRIKEGMRNTLMDIDTVKAGIPQYADRILLELDKPETRRQLSAFLVSLLSDITEETFGQVDDSVRQDIRERHGCAGSITECKALINDRLAHHQGRSRNLAGLALICALLMLLEVKHAGQAGNRAQWILLSGAAGLLLACGILTPMIEVEAQINQLSFTLMGEPVRFYNEVLYFQSKSILDVVSILTATREPDMVLVGVLLVTFSVAFPLLKLLASIAYAYDLRGLRHNAFIEFFALKSGKWSMADVMVIAILMAYIAFNGMINSQLNLISQGARRASVEVLTTNGTTLQLGFFMFLSFCLFSLLVSTLMETAISLDETSTQRE
ncbi:paraquat-inducible protein A [Elongatibacter sediminis]|uniref:Paraquat-inducible protein A n=1 Tax=Elongatibacter sediminis TaxID=3119006 RepID=A0AAW9RCG2_9GAMM